MFVTNTAGRKLRLTKYRLSEILPESNYSNNTYSYVLLTELAESFANRTSVGLYPLNRHWTKNKHWFWDRAEIVKPNLVIIGCCDFSFDDAQKIIKAVKDAVRTKKGTKKKKK